MHPAGFYVLVGAGMPSVLFETSYISNPIEEQRLGSEEYRQLLADAIANAVKAYREGALTSQRGASSGREPAASQDEAGGPAHAPRQRRCAPDSPGRTSAIVSPPASRCGTNSGQTGSRHAVSVIAMASTVSHASPRSWSTR